MTECLYKLLRCRNCFRLRWCINLIDVFYFIRYYTCCFLTLYHTSCFLTRSVQISDQNRIMCGGLRTVYKMCIVSFYTNASWFTRDFLVPSLKTNTHPNVVGACDRVGLVGAFRARSSWRSSVVESVFVVALAFFQIWMGHDWGSICGPSSGNSIFGGLEILSRIG